MTRRHDGNGRWLGPERAASRPAELLAVRGDLDGLRTRTAADGGSAARQLVELMTQQSQFGEAQQLQRFGLNLDLAREGKRYLKAPGRKVDSMRRESGSVGNRFPT